MKKTVRYDGLFVGGDDMLKACGYCGKIHDAKYICDKKPRQESKAKDRIYYFRNSTLWKCKSKEIRTCTDRLKTF